MSEILTSLSEEEQAVAERAVMEHRIAQAAKLFGDPLTVYAAEQNTDLTEGRGPLAIRGYFFIKSEAEKARDMLSGPQGIKNDIPVRPIRIYVTAEKWNAEEKAGRRR